MTRPPDRAGVRRPHSLHRGYPVGALLVWRTRLDVRFHLRDEAFLNPSAVQRRDAELVPVSEVLGESPQYGALLRRAGIDHDDPDDDTFYDRLEKVHDIRQYAMPILTIDDDVDDDEVVADIFARVNQGGRRLSKGDLVYSAIAARWPEGLDTIDPDGAGSVLSERTDFGYAPSCAGPGRRTVRIRSVAST